MVTRKFEKCVSVYTERESIGLFYIRIGKLMSLLIPRSGVRVPDGPPLNFKPTCINAVGFFVAPLFLVTKLVTVGHKTNYSASRYWALT